MGEPIASLHSRLTRLWRFQERRNRLPFEPAAYEEMRMLVGAALRERLPNRLVRQARHRVRSYRVRDDGCAREQWEPVVRPDPGFDGWSGMDAYRYDQ